MADSVSVTNFPDSGSPERVAYDLMKWVGGADPKPQGRAGWLDLYAECLRATRGARPKP